MRLSLRFAGLDRYLHGHLVEPGGLRAGLDTMNLALCHIMLRLSPRSHLWPCLPRHLELALRHITQCD